MGAIGRIMGCCWLVLCSAGVGRLEAQTMSAGLPFGIGEELVYRVRSARFGSLGNGIMRVVGPVSIRGRSAYHLQFVVKGRWGPFNIEDFTQSWLDPEGPAALRFEKQERHPLATRTEEVELIPAERRWVAADGSGGEMITDTPLDELSFIYLLRMLDLEEGTEVSLDRHYQAERNPVVVRLLRRERMTFPAGVFPIRLIEMRVRDGKRFDGAGVIRLYLTDDDRRYPVRIETTMPVVGAMILELEALTPAPREGTGGESHGDSVADNGAH